MLEMLVEDCLPCEGSHTKAWEECEQSPAEEEGTEATCDELSAAHILCTRVPRSGRSWRNLGVKLSPGKRERWKESLGFSSHYPDLILLEINKANFLRSSLFCPCLLLVNDLSMSLSPPTCLLLYLLSLVQLRRGMTEWLWWHLVSIQGQPNTSPYPKMLRKERA